MKARFCFYVTLWVSFGYFNVQHLAYADVLSELAQMTIEEDSPEVVTEKDVFFDANVDDLSKMNIQLGLQVIEPGDFKNNYRAFDFDKLAKKLHSCDRVIVAKSVAVIKNVQPSSFTASLFLSPEFLNKVMTDTRNRVIDADRNIVEQIRDFKFTSITSQTTFASYNFEDQQGEHMDSQTAQQLLRTLQFTRKPQALVTAYAGEDDISTASYGSRITNFYFAINEEDTLAISQIVLTLKKEDKFLFKLFWPKILASCPKALQRSTAITVTNLRKQFSL